MVDASHDNSGKDHARQPEVGAEIARQIGEGNAAIVGVMLESFLVEGRQDLDAGTACRSPTDSRSPTRACRGTRRWECSTSLRARCERGERRPERHRGHRCRVDRRLDRARGPRAGRRARARLGPGPAALAAALERGALDEACGSVAEALADAETAFVAAPVGALGEALDAVLAAAAPECVVTDVGSTKRAVVEGRDDPRFVGGHPLAGAETAGVAHARADLFEGATWYLTPTPTTSGLLYERLHRLAGRARRAARPRSMPTAHDRLMASVSHLPHVLANVLVSQAAQALSDERGAAARHRPELPRRDPRRRRQHAHLDRHLPGQPRRRRRGASTTPSAAWRRCAGRSPRPTRRPWRSGTTRARADRRALLEAGLAGGAGARAARVGAQPARRHRARSRSSSAARASTSPTWRCIRPPTCATGVVALWIAGDDAAERAEELWPGSASRWRAREPSVASSRRRTCAGELAPPPDKSISHRAALIGAMGAEPVRIRNYLRRRPTPTRRWTPVRTLGRDRRGPARRARDPRRRACASAQTPDEPIDVGNAGTLMRLLPGWLAGAGGPHVHARRRRLDPPAARSTAIAEPLRLMGARHRGAATGASRRSPSTARACAAIDYELPVASAQVKSCVLLAGLRRRRRRRP